MRKNPIILHLISKFSEEEVNSRMNYFILREPISDGGNWNMILNIINKYPVLKQVLTNLHI